MSTEPAPPQRYALDQALGTAPVVEDEAASAHLHPLMSIDVRMGALSDVALLRALHHHAEPWEGLVTLDAAVRHLPSVLCALEQLGLALVVLPTEPDPLAEGSRLREHLAEITEARRAGTGQVWDLGGARRGPTSARVLLERMALRQGTDAAALWEQHGLSQLELRFGPLS